MTWSTSEVPRSSRSQVQYPGAWKCVVVVLLVDARCVEVLGWRVVVGVVFRPRHRGEAVVAGRPTCPIRFQERWRAEEDVQGEVPRRRRQYQSEGRTLRRIRLGRGPRRPDHRGSECARAR